MPTPRKGARLGGSPAHQRLILSNLATALFEHGRITTTEAKARVLRPVAEKLITKAKKGDLHNRREVLKTIHDKSVVHVLFTEIAPTFAERPGGYTRITKIGPRKGDNAPMAVIELVTESYTPSAPKAKQAAPAKVEAPVEARPRRRSTARADEVVEDRGGHGGLRRLPRPARGRRPGARGLPDQGQPGLDEVPRARRPVVRADGRRGLVRLGRLRRGRRLHEGRRVAPPRRLTRPVIRAAGGGPCACRGVLRVGGRARRRHTRGVAPPAHPSASPGAPAARPPPVARSPTATFLRWALGWAGWCARRREVAGGRQAGGPAGVRRFHTLVPELHRIR